jgi:hypothetical protein
VAREVTDYAFVRVEGDGVHEIPVGPVHAGIIEPGHFRFSVVGEKVLRLEQRLGYKHKGIEQRFTELPPLEGASPGRAGFGRLDGGLRLGLLHGARVGSPAAGCPSAPLGCARCCWNASASPTTWATSARWATTPLSPSAWPVLAPQGRLAAPVGEAFGHRLMMDCIVPGGVAMDIDQHDQRDRLARQCDAVEREVQPLRQVYDEHAGLQDRFMTTGRVPPNWPLASGLTGLAGRASGQAADLRCDQPWPPYDQLAVKMSRRRQWRRRGAGGGAFRRGLESLRLMRLLLLHRRGGRRRSAIAAAGEGGVRRSAGSKAGAAKSSWR